MRPSVCSWGRSGREGQWQSSCTCTSWSGWCPWSPRGKPETVLYHFPTGFSIVMTGKPESVESLRFITLACYLAECVSPPNLLGIICNEESNSVGFDLHPARVDLNFCLHCTFWTFKSILQTNDQKCLHKRVSCFSISRLIETPNFSHFGIMCPQIRTFHPKTGY